MKESGGRNLKMANRGNQGKVYQKINTKKCQKVILGPPEHFFSESFTFFENFINFSQLFSKISDAA